MNIDIDWDEIDTVLLDMDGTLLDLHFDNHFWLEHLPMRFAARQGLSLADAREQLGSRYGAVRGTLDWYCLDYWSASLGMDIVALKQEVAHLIDVHPHVLGFLDAARAAGKLTVLVTNAHPASLALKMARTPLGGHLDVVLSAHAFGLPKEAPSFWARLRERQPFDPARSLLVDDNLDVLESAREAGIAHLRGVRQPDSRGGVMESAAFELIGGFDELMPVGQPFGAAASQGAGKRV
ncbi:MAG: GMP/IMP nucleotidase [Halothiobacillaceae bacterium]|nr:MAG: GMP/IMP nucleotidase [Halothiobacillaceae bacterium]